MNTTDRLTALYRERAATDDTLTNNFIASLVCRNLIWPSAGTTTALQRMLPTPTQVSNALALISCSMWESARAAGECYEIDDYRSRLVRRIREATAPDDSLLIELVDYDYLADADDTLEVLDASA